MSKKTFGKYITLSSVKDVCFDVGVYQSGGCVVWIWNITDKIFKYVHNVHVNVTFTYICDDVQDIYMCLGCSYW